MGEMQIYRGEIFYFTASPLEQKDAYCFYPDGALVINEGKVVEVAPFKEVSSRYANAQYIDYTGKLIMPGLIDAHVHYPQIEMIGMYGNQLLDWLSEYTFPVEETFASPEHASTIARFFLQELFRNGTTTCMAYATIYPQSVDALFSAASQYNMRILTGKMLMDENASSPLQDDLTIGMADSKKLIEAWHGKGRNHYVITPRFAMTSSQEQLLLTTMLHRMYPDTYVQTHLSENREEVAFIARMYPRCTDYLEVYERVGLIKERTVLGHGIHLSEDEYRRIAEAGASIAHCPTSNLFLGSGLYDMKQANDFGVQTVLGTDVGAGTSLSMFRTMGEAYKVQQLNGYPVSALELLYRCTLGTAKALKLEDKIGSFMPGREADFIVVDYASTPLQKLRKDYLVRTDKWTIENKLFGLQIQGDDRAVIATYLMGKNVWDNL